MNKRSIVIMAMACIICLVACQKKADAIGNTPIRSASFGGQRITDSGVCYTRKKLGRLRMLRLAVGECGFAISIYIGFNGST